MPTKSKKSKKKGALAFACWALGFLIIVIIFLVKLDDIKSNLKQTNAFERLFHTTPTFIQNYEDKRTRGQEELPVEETFVATNESQLPLSPISSLLDDEPYTPAFPLPPSAETLSSALMATDAEAGIAAQPTTVSDDDMEADETPPAAYAKANNGMTDAAAQTAVAAVSQPQFVTTNAKLCFVSIDSDGIVSRKEITRTIKKSETPLTENIKQLLTGPTQAEQNKGCRSLIPDGTRLLSATVRDGTALLNFSEEFEYNQSFGVEGYLGQLMQIVYTATEFSTVTSVQVLVDGQKKDYLGSEGVWIGSPLARTSFK